MSLHDVQRRAESRQERVADHIDLDEHLRRYQDHLRRAEGRQEGVAFEFELPEGWPTYFDRMAGVGYREPGTLQDETYHQIQDYYRRDLATERRVQETIRDRVAAAEGRQAGPTFNDPLARQDDRTTNALLHALTDGYAQNWRDARIYLSPADVDYAPRRFGGVPVEAAIWVRPGFAVVTWSHGVTSATV